MNEPQTTAKIRLNTSKGVVDIELWAKETPLTSKWLLEQVLAGALANASFPRISNKTVAVGELEAPQVPQKVERHSRLRFNRRGLLGVRSNGCVFLTLDETPQSDATLIGKVIGDGSYVVNAIGSGDVDDSGDFRYPPKIMKAEVLVRFFEGLKEPEAESKAEAKAVAVATNSSTNFKRPRVLVSFNDDEDEEEESELDIKMRSAHDVLFGRPHSAPGADRSSALQSPPAASQVPSLADSADTVNDSSQDSGFEAENPQKRTREDTDEEGEMKKNKTKGKDARDLETLAMLQDFQARANAQPSWMNDDSDESE